MRYYAAKSRSGRTLGIGTTREAAREHARKNLRAVGKPGEWAYIAEVSETEFMLRSTHGIFAADQKAAASN